MRNDSESRWIQTGLLENVDENFQTETYHSSFVGDPVVITQSQTTNGDQAIVTRLKNVGSGLFEVRLQEQEGLGGHRDEDVAWLATPADSGYLDAWQYEAGRISGVTHNWSTIHFTNSYDNPVFLADMQTFNGSDPAGLRRQNLTGESVDVKVEEEGSGEEETEHTYGEEVGYFVIKS